MRIRICVLVRIGDTSLLGCGWCLLNGGPEWRIRTGLRVLRLLLVEVMVMVHMRIWVRVRSRVRVRVMDSGSVSVCSPSLDLQVEDCNGGEVFERAVRMPAHRLLRPAAQPAAHLVSQRPPPGLLWHKQVDKGEVEVAPAAAPLPQLVGSGELLAGLRLGGWRGMLKISCYPYEDD